MYVMYDGSHSISFMDSSGNIKNTWDDWQLIPTKKPTVAMPGFASNYVDIPGRNGSIDISNYLTGGPSYSDRSGSWEFRMIGTTTENWDERINRIAQFLHGKQMKIILKDDPMYYFEGRISFSEKNTDDPTPKITFSYRVGPFKKLIGGTETKF